MDLYDILLQKQVDDGGEGSFEPIIESLSISENGTYSVPSGVDGYNPVIVNVSGGGSGDQDVEDAFLTRTISGMYENNRVTYIDQAVLSRTSVTIVKFDAVSQITVGAFNSCSALSQAIFPNLELLSGGNAFDNCSALQNVSVPKLKIMATAAFRNCATLPSISMPSIQSIASYAFLGCSRLSAVYLLGSSVPSLGSYSAFSGTPMANSTYTGSFGSIYVPASLVSAYKSASNWSAFADRITSYESE